MRRILGAAAAATALLTVLSPSADAQRGDNAWVSFRAPNDLSIAHDGTCLTPTFRWRVSSTAPDGSAFNGTAIVTKVGGKRYGSMHNMHYTLDAWQRLRTRLPICAPGKYKVTVHGRVWNEQPENPVFYTRVRDSHVYRVTHS